MNFAYSSNAKLFWVRLFAVATAVSLIFGSSLFINHANAATVLFSDDFEDGTFDAWDTPSDGWSIESPDGAESTTYYAKVIGVSDELVIKQVLSTDFFTEGHENLLVTFYYQRMGMDSGDSVALEMSLDEERWGPVWTAEGEDGDGDDSGAWEYAEVELPSSLDDKEVVYLRFVSRMNAANDMFLLDQINVIGEEIYEGLFFDLFGTKFFDEPGDGEYEFEEGLRRWLISLYEFNEEEDAYDEHSETRTNRDGDYGFEGVKEGEYLLCENRNPRGGIGWEQTFPFEDDERDHVSVVDNSESPNADREAAMCYGLDLHSELGGEESEPGDTVEVSDLDFANHHRDCLVEGIKYQTNRHGKPIPLEGWTIGLTGYGIIEEEEEEGEEVYLDLTATTDERGYYCIELEEEEELVEGRSYVVYEELQPGWEPRRVKVDDRRARYRVKFYGEAVPNGEEEEEEVVEYEFPRVATYVDDLPVRVDFFNRQVSCIVDGYKYDENGEPLEGWEIALETWAGVENPEYDSEAEESEEDEWLWVLEQIGKTAVTDSSGYYCVENDYFFLRNRHGDHNGHDHRDHGMDHNYHLYEILQPGWNPDGVRKVRNMRHEMYDLDEDEEPGPELRIPPPYPGERPGEAKRYSVRYNPETGQYEVYTGLERIRRPKQIDFYNEFQGCLIEGHKYDREENPVPGVEIGLLAEFRRESMTQIDPPTLEDGPEQTFVPDSFFDIDYQIFGTDNTDENGRYCIVDEKRLLEDNRLDVENPNDIPTELVQLELTGRGSVAEEMPEGWQVFDVLEDGGRDNGHNDSFFDVFFDIAVEDRDRGDHGRFDSFFDIFVEVKFDKENERFTTVDFFNEQQPPDQGGSSSGSRVDGGGSVLGASTGPEGGSVLGASAGPSCNPPWLSDFIGDGVGASADQILRLQVFLNEVEGESLEYTGVYDDATADAVARFQLKYRTDVLDPWGLALPTRVMWLTSTNKVNDLLGCGLPLPDGPLVPFPGDVIPAPATPGEIFSDGFESGDTSSWSIGR